jgi:hypothetical protein
MPSCEPDNFLDLVITTLNYFSSQGTQIHPYFVWLLLAFFLWHMTRAVFRTMIGQAKKREDSSSRTRRHDGDHHDHGNDSD